MSVVVSRLIAKVESDLVGFNKGMGEAENRMIGAGRRMSATGQQITRKVGLPLALIGGYAFKASMDYNKALIQMRTMAGSTGVQVARLHNVFLKWAGDSVMSATDFANAFYHVQSVMGNTITMAHKLAATKAVEKIVTLSLGDVAPEEAATAFIGAMRTRIKGVQNLNEAVARMNAIVGTGNMKWHDLIAAWGTGILPAAKAAGLSLADVGAILAIQTDETVRSSSAMTRLGTSLTKFAGTGMSKEAKAELKSIGLTTQQMAFMMQQPHGILKMLDLLHMKLNQKFDLSTRKGRAQAFSLVADVFGGARGARQVMLLLNQHDLLWRKLRQQDAMVKGDHLKSGLKAAEATPYVKMLKAKNAMNAAFIQLGEALTPFVLQLAHAVTTLANGFSKLPKSVKNFIAILIVVGVVIGPLLTLFGKFFILLGQFGRLAKWITELELFQNALLRVRLAFIALAEGEGLAGFMAMIGPGGIILIIVAVVAGLVLLYMKCKWFRDKVNETWQFIKKITVDLYNFVKKYWPYIFAAMTFGASIALSLIIKHWKAIKNFIVNTSIAIYNFVKKYWPYIAGALFGAVGLMVAYVATHYKQIWHLIVTITVAIKNAIVRGWNAVVNAIKHAAGLIYSAATAVWHRVLNFFGGLARSLGNKIKNAMLAIVRWLKAAAVWVYNAAKHLGTQIKNGVIDGLSGIGASIAKKLDPLQRIPGGKQAEHGVGWLWKHRAGGGPVTAGSPYMVGERGPEMFVPSASGTIVPHGGDGGGDDDPFDPSGGGSGGGAHVHINELSVRSEEDVYSIASAIGRKIQM